MYLTTRRWHLFARLSLASPIMICIMAFLINPGYFSDLGEWINEAGRQRWRSARMSMAIIQQDEVKVRSIGSSWLLAQSQLKETMPECLSEVSIGIGVEEIRSAMDISKSDEERAELAYSAGFKFNTVIDRVSQYQRNVANRSILYIVYVFCVLDILSTIFLISTSRPGRD